MGKCKVCNGVILGKQMLGYVESKNAEHIAEYFHLGCGHKSKRKEIRDRARKFFGNGYFEA